MKFSSLRIEGLALNGEGFAHAGRRKVFVAGTLAGELVSADAVELKSKFSRAKLQEILEASELRVAPKCQHVPACGGCRWQHIQYDEQLALKQAQLEKQLTQFAKLATLPAIEVLAGDAFAYRNRARMLVEWSDTGAHLAMRTAASRSPVRIRQCDILHPTLQAEFNEIEAWCTDNGAEQIGKEIRLATDGQGISIAISGRAKQLSQWPHGPVVNLNGDILNNAPPLSYQSADAQLHFTAADFTQANLALNQRVIDWLLRALPQNNTVIDLFAGLGNLTLPLASISQQITGYEVVESMVARAAQNASLNALTQCQFKAANLYDQCPSLACDVLVADPPRAGLGNAVIQQIAAYQPSTVAYMSCSIESLVRELPRLCAMGYHIERLALIDFFAQSPEIETITILRSQPTTA
ncbi:MAG: class I SAM-dependent RNA methyltransferase [Gammaproteobacteria bacterium]|nr:class I SAM-dependent RNA methyltransferase [Gammaproteobacteria bacterium]